MNRGFWDKLEKPIMALAPMANVTDVAFRFLIAKYGKPEVMFTEFVSVEGLLSDGKDKLMVDFWYEENQRPIVAQIFGSKPEQFEKVAKMIVDLGFDGIDINMGCPDKGVIKQKAGGACIRDPKLALEIIDATKRGAGKLPVSVKTRIGFGKIDIENWIPVLANAGLAAITVHLRTVKEMSKVPAHWELMPEITRIIKGYSAAPRVSSDVNRYTQRQQITNDAPILLGNGDVQSVAEAKEKVDETGCDGVMLGRAIFGNPWLFASTIPSVSEKLQVMIEHTKLFEEKFVGIKNFEIMKKHYKAYVTGFDGAKELRMKLMETKSSNEVKRAVLEFLTISVHA
jgi:nifR3 family TIM-barrel protein